MRDILELVLPAEADNTIRGSRIPFYVFAVFAVISTVRSCIHLLAPDGGAGSIAGMDLSVEGADGIIFAFALWGSSQLLFALIQLLAVFRYRSLIPLMYLFLILEILLRELVGVMKSVSFAQPPPGAIANWIILPLAVVLLGLALWTGMKADPSNRN
jgi:hypothetical protein